MKVYPLYFTLTILRMVTVIVWRIARVVYLRFVHFGSHVRVQFHLESHYLSVLSTVWICPNIVHYQKGQWVVQFAH